MILTTVTRSFDAIFQENEYSRTVADVNWNRRLAMFCNNEKAAECQAGSAGPQQSVVDSKLACQYHLSSVALCRVEIQAVNRPR